MTREIQPLNPAQTNLITSAGYDRMYAELRKLSDEDRPVLLVEIADAAAQGDRSENAEYIYGRKKLREVDKRVNYLKGRLERAKIIDPKLQPTDVIGFGAVVVIVGEDGVEKKWWIIGEDEADPSAGIISWLSPLGRALMKKKIGDNVEVETPRGQIEYQILKITY